MNLENHMCMAKTLDTGDWVRGYYVAVPEEFSRGTDICHAIFSQDNEHVCMGEYKDYGWYKVDPSSLCRFTGWKDSFGKPIFENDVVRFKCGNTYDRILIWWCREMNMMTAVPLDGIEFNGFDYWNGNCPHFEYSTFCLMMQDPYGDFSEIKVVGNIIDNSKLMEVHS